MVVFAGFPDGCHVSQVAARAMPSNSACARVPGGGSGGGMNGSSIQFHRFLWVNRFHRSNATRLERVERPGAPVMPRCLSLPSQLLRPVSISRRLLAWASWQKGMATKWSQLANPFERCSQPVSRTSFAKRWRSTRERSWLKRLEVATFNAVLPVRHVIGFSFTPIPSVQGGFFNLLFWTVVIGPNSPKRIADSRAASTRCEIGIFERRPISCAY